MKRMHLAACVFLLLAAAAASCNMPAGVPTAVAPPLGGDQHAWMDAPLDGMNLPLAPYEVVFHGGDNAGVNLGQLTVNGAVEAELPNPTAGSLVTTFRHVWSPDAPGRYTLSARIQNGSGAWSNESTVVVTIGEITPTVTTLTPTPTPTGAATVTPTGTPAPLLAGSIEIVSVSTGTVYYGGNCGPNEVTIQARVVEPKGIAAVELYYRLNGNGSTDYESKPMALLRGENLYAVTVNPEQQFGSRTAAGIGDGWFQYQVIVQDNSGGTSTRTRVLSDVAFAGCAAAPVRPGLPVAPTTRPPFIFAPTDTPYVVR
jgi:hypothetical protein